MRLNNVHSRSYKKQNKVIDNLHNWLKIFQKSSQKLLNILHHQKKFLFCVCIYEMVNIDKEIYENNNTEAIVDGIGTFWLNEKHIEQSLGHENLPVITNKYGQVYKRHRCDIVNEPKKRSNRRFLLNDSTSKVIMNCRTDE